MNNINKSAVIAPQEQQKPHIFRPKQAQQASYIFRPHQKALYEPHLFRQNKQAQQEPHSILKNSDRVYTGVESSNIDNKIKVEDTNSLTSAHTIISIVMILTLDVIFISIFYFLFIVKKEKELIVHDMNGLVDSICSDLELLPEDQKQSILQYVNSMKTDTSNDQQVIDSNKVIFNKAMKVLIIFFIISLIFIIIVAKIFSVNLLPILLTNIILLAVIFFTELLFINQINSKYIALDSNLIKEHIITQLQKN